MLTLYEPLVWLARPSGELLMYYKNGFLLNAPSKYELNGMVFGSLGKSPWLCSYRKFFLSNLWWFGGCVWEAKGTEFGGEPNKKTVGGIERIKTERMSRGQEEAFTEESSGGVLVPQRVLEGKTGRGHPDCWTRW